MTAIILHETNYQEWVGYMEDILKREDLLCYVNGTRPCPETMASSSSALEVWKNNDARAFAMLLQNVSLNIGAKIMRLERRTSQEVWKYLQVQYQHPGCDLSEKMYSLLQQFRNLDQGDSSVVDFSKKFISLRLKIDAVDPACPLCSTCKARQEAQCERHLLYDFLLRLRPNLQVISTRLMRGPFKTIAEVLPDLMEMESEINNTPSQRDSAPASPAAANGGATPPATPAGPATPPARAIPAAANGDELMGTETQMKNITSSQHDHDSATPPATPVAGPATPAAAANGDELSRHVLEACKTHNVMQLKAKMGGLWGTTFIDLLEAKMGCPPPLKPPQQISEVAEEGECGLNEMVGEVGEDDDSVLFGPEDIRDSDSDSFYLEELHSSIDQTEYLGFLDSESEGDTFYQMEDDIFGKMEDDIFGKMEDDYFDKVSDDFNEEDDGQQADGGIEDEPSSAGKQPTEEEADILGDQDVVQVENGIVRRWACANFSYLSHEQSRRFLARIVDMCGAIGMEFNPAPIDVVQAEPSDIERTLSNLTKCGRKEEQLGILLMILSEDDYSDVKVEEVCADLGVTFYYCYASEVRSLSKGALKSIAYEIQSKVVMRDARLRRLAFPLVSEAPMLIFGADIVRCTPGDDNSDFIASVVTSLDWPKFRRYHVGLSHDEGDTKVSARLGSLVSEFINSFSKRGKGNVEKIIFFRNGLKDGQFGDICHQEMSAIKKACAHFMHGYQLDITYVVVLPQASMEMADKSGPAADLSGYKFLCRHSGGKKFSSLACYHVVHDDNDFLPGELQSLTSKLCGIRDRREFPEIDIVPPAYYAKRAGMASLEEWRRTKQLMKFRGTESYLVL